MIIKVYAERDGDSLLVGQIETTSDRGETFAYDASWLAHSEPKPLSISLPLSKSPYDARAIRPYFDGLLPEGHARAAIASRLHVSERAYIRLLDGLGHECIGAVSLQGPSAMPGDSYVEVPESKLERFAVQSYPLAAEASERAHFSLAGSQAKIALYRNADGSWHEPHGMAPSTHILKPATERFERVAANEALCTMAAGACGLEVPHTIVLYFGRPVICTQRFDRVLPDKARVIDGMPAPLRLHQEDCCQALAIVPESKYEGRQRGDFARIAKLLREESTEPIPDLLRLWDFAAFNYLIGNCDAHLKNIALLRDATWRRLSLAPFYDLLCTTCYEELSGDMAMSIGDTRKLASVSASSFEGLAKSMGVPWDIASTRLESLCRNVPSALADAASRLEAQEVDLGDLADRIIKISNAHATRITG